MPKHERNATDPRTPDKNLVQSKRSFDGRIRKWRQQLHQYDDTEEDKIVKDYEMEGDRKENIEMADNKIVNESAENKNMMFGKFPSLYITAINMNMAVYYHKYKYGSMLP